MTLIEELTNASGPNHDLDGRIYCAVNSLKFRSVGRNGSIHFEPDAKGTHTMVTPHPYTESIDLAMTLIPEASAWAVSHGDPDPEGYPKPYRATVMPPLDRPELSDATQWHENPAIALCMAALMARGILG